jgi:hypothetical protein
MPFSFNHGANAWRSLVHPAKVYEADLPFLNAAMFQGRLGELAETVGGLIMALAAPYKMRIGRL